MKPHERRIEATYLARCSPDEAYRWLELRALRSDDELRRNQWYDDKILEYILCRRRNHLIDLALARFARTSFVVRKVFRRGGPGIRCAAWTNPAERNFSPAGIWCDKQDLKDLVETGHIRDLEAFASNIGLSDQGIISLIRRENEFSHITERRYIRALYALTTNSRLGAAYGDNRPMDGWAEHMHDNVFKEIWGLTLTLPADQIWAQVLASLVRNCLPPHSFEFDAAIARWRIDSPKKNGEKHYWPGSSFDLRSCIADALAPDDALKDADDLALRLSFYRRFDPTRYTEWTDLVARDFSSWDPEQAAYDVLHNKHLWQTTEQRERLRELCWAVPDPNSDMQLPNAYRETWQRMEKEFPLWFTDEDRAEPETPRLEAEIHEQLSDILLKMNRLTDIVTAQSETSRLETKIHEQLSDILLKMNRLTDIVTAQSETSRLETKIREQLSHILSKVDRLTDLAAVQPKPRRFPFG